MPSLATLLREHKLALRARRPDRPGLRDPDRPTDVLPKRHPPRPRRSNGGCRLNRDGEPRLRFHDLRHTLASLLIAQGLNIVFVSRQLGHASPSFTLDAYGHVFDRAEHARRASDGLEAAFSQMLTSHADAQQLVCDAASIGGDEGLQPPDFASPRGGRSTRCCRGRPAGSNRGRSRRGCRGAPVLGRACLPRT